MVGLAIVAAGLRVWGVMWGLPGADRMCSYHPDEGVNLVNGVLDRGVLRPHLDIGFYNYGSLYFLVWQAAAAANSVYGFVSLGPAPGPGVPLTDSLASLTLVGRVLSVLFASATVGFVCLLGREAFGFRAGMVAGVLQAVAPLAALHSRFATVDSTATFLVVACLCAALRVVRRRDVPSAVWAGLLAGLAAATRYNTVLVLAAVIAAILVRGAAVGAPYRREVIRLSAYAFGACALGFLIGCPGVAMNWPKFSADLMFELAKSGQGMGLLFAETGNGWLYHWSSSLRHGLGWPLLIVATLAALAALRRRDRNDVVLLAFVVPYYVLMGAAQVRFMRYMLPVLPVLFVWIGAAVARSGASVPRNRALRLVGAIAVALGFGVALLTTMAFSAAMTGSDARDVALAHIRRHVPADTRSGGIAFATVPWFWSPPLLPEFTAPVPGAVRRDLVLNARSDYRLRLPGPGREWDQSVLEGPEPDAVVVSDLESQDAYRVGDAQALAFAAVLRRSYQGRTVGSRPSALGWQVLSDGPVPVDLLYVCPRVTIYTRRPPIGPGPRSERP
jgi:hypothetical protein